MDIKDAHKYIQQNLRVDKLKHNEFGGFDYRTYEDILKALKPLLAKADASLVLEDNLIYVEGRWYIEATATLYDENGEYISNKAYAREAQSEAKKSESQVTGSASTYARKSALSGLFLIADTADPDGFTATDEVQKRIDLTKKAKKEPQPPQEYHRKDEPPVDPLKASKISLANSAKMHGIDIKRLAEKYPLSKYTATELDHLTAQIERGEIVV